jgi:hypothetical protein
MRDSVVAAAIVTSVPCACFGGEADIDCANTSAAVAKAARVSAILLIFGPPFCAETLFHMGKRKVNATTPSRPVRHGATMLFQRGWNAAAEISGRYRVG